MSKNNVVELTGREQIRDELTDLIRTGARKLITQGLELEVSELLSTLSARQDEQAVLRWSGTATSRSEIFRQALVR